MRTKVYSTLLLCLFLNSCDMVEYHPYDGRTDVEGINEANIERIIANTQGKEEFSYVWMGDSQRWYNETEDFVEYVNKNLSVDFVMHGGDISDFGTTDEFEWIHRIMNKLKVPYVALIGNHDVIGTGRYVYEQMYGDDNFSFNVADVKFICLNTNALEYEYNDNVPNFDYVSSELTNLTNPARTIAALHAAPCSDQLNSTDGRNLHTALTKFNDLMFCMNAHGHSTSITDTFSDGVMYYQCASMKGRSFFLFTITKTGYEYEEIFF